MAGPFIGNGHHSPNAEATLSPPDIQIDIRPESNLDASAKNFLTSAVCEEYMLFVHRILSMAVAGMQLAARPEGAGLHALVDKIAVATIASNALGHLSALNTLSGSISAAAAGDTCQMFTHDLIKTAALGLGITSGALVFADPDNHLSTTHDNLVKASFAFAGSAVLFGLLKWMNYASIR